MRRSQRNVRGLLDLDDRDVVMIQRLPFGTGARAIQSVCRSSGMLVKSNGSAYIAILAHLEIVFLFLARRGRSACAGVISIRSEVAFVSGSRFSSSLLSLRDNSANESMFLDESTRNRRLCGVGSDVRKTLKQKWTKPCVALRVISFASGPVFPPSAAV